MLKTTLLHPEILYALGRAGHGARVLIADGNYPVSTGAPQTATKVFLNLSPGLVKVTDVLASLVATIPVEHALLMAAPDGASPPVHAEFRRLLPDGTSVAAKSRFDFYAEAKAADTALIIATGEERRFANILLTIGVMRKDNA